MTTAVLNNPFQVFNQISTKRKSSFSRKQNITDFDQPVPSVEKPTAYRNFDYTLDALSQVVSNQTLSPEQLVKSQTKATDEQVDSLSRKYKIIRVEEVKKFLLKNRFLILLLEEIPNKIYEYYGNEQEISLELFYEPDFPQSSKLWVSVLTEKSAEDARSIMDRIDEDWWLENIDRANCKLNIGIDYV